MGASTSPHSARPKHWPQFAVLALPRKAATHRVQSGEKSHIHSPQKHFLVYIDDKFKHLSWRKSIIPESASPRQNSHICFNWTKHNFYYQWFRHWYFLKYFNASVNHVYGQHKSRVQGAEHFNAYSAKNIHEQLEHNLKD